MAGKEGAKEGVGVRETILESVGAQEAVVFEEGAVMGGGGRVPVGVVII